MKLREVASVLEVMQATDTFLESVIEETLGSQPQEVREDAIHVRSLLSQAIKLLEESKV